MMTRDYPRQLDATFIHVGDGLCHRLDRPGWGPVGLQIDCGSQQGARLAAERWQRTTYPSALLHTGAICVTHYHTDHYNGLVWAARQSSFPRLPFLGEFYHPGTPTTETRHLLRALFAVHSYTVGSTGLPMDVDLWQTLTRLSGLGSVGRRALYQGDTVTPRGTVLNVVWPPRTLNDSTQKSVARALRAFHELLESPERGRLRDLYSQTELVETSEDEGSYEHDPDTIHERPLPEKRTSESELDSGLAVVNHKLRKAANRLSLALVVNHRLLCLGDLEGKQLGAAVEHTVSEFGGDFDVVVAPHHGTKWHPSMDKLRARVLVVPVGPELWKHVTPNLGRISSDVRFSHVHGDIRM